MERKAKTLAESMRLRMLRGCHNSRASSRSAGAVLDIAEQGCPGLCSTSLTRNGQGVQEQLPVDDGPQRIDCLQLEQSLLAVLVAISS